MIEIRLMRQERDEPLIRMKPTSSPTQTVYLWTFEEAQKAAEEIIQIIRLYKSIIETEGFLEAAKLLKEKAMRTTREKEKTP